jgi:hypothetical protein
MSVVKGASTKTQGTALPTAHSRRTAGIMKRLAARLSSRAMANATIGSFTPMRDGFHFANSFPHAAVITFAVPGWGKVAIGDAANGVCGGMVFAVRDLYEAHLSPPADTVPPAEATGFFAYLTRRLVESFDLPEGPLRYYQWMSLPDEDTWVSRGVWSMTVREEWPKVRDQLDRGKLCPLGLIRTRSSLPADLGKNHQVLAYGYEPVEPGRAVRIFLYDPNHPDEEVQMSFDPAAAGHLTYSSGEATRGFFLTRYKRTDPSVIFGPVSAGLVTAIGRLVRPIIARKSPAKEMSK